MGLTQEEIRRRLIGRSRDTPDLRKRGHLGSRFSALQYRIPYAESLRWADPAGTVLDWGCGNGHFSFFLASSGFEHVESYGFRTPELASELAPLGVPFHLGRRELASTIPMATASFDCVFSAGVLEHVRESGGTELASLREIHRILRPHGLFICFHFPNRRSLIEALARRIPGKYSHRFLFCEQDIRSLCAEAGFKLQRIRLYGILPRNLFSSRGLSLADHPWGSNLLEALDRALSMLLHPFCQNFLFVASKRQQGWTGEDPDGSHCT